MVKQGGMPNGARLVTDGLERRFCAECDMWCVPDAYLDCPRCGASLARRNEDRRRKGGNPVNSLFARCMINVALGCESWDSLQNMARRAAGMCGLDKDSEIMEALLPFARRIVTSLTDLCVLERSPNRTGRTVYRLADTGRIGPEPPKQICLDAMLEEDGPSELHLGDFIISVRRGLR